jgi:protein phosphatase
LDWLSAAVTHRGKVREYNEDAYLDQPDARVWAVADGMGGHHAGDVASREVVASLADLRPSDKLSSLIANCRERIAGVNADLFETGMQRQAQIIGSTVVVLLASGRQGALLWAGDSRGYRLRGDRFEQLTQDHSRVSELVKQGQLDPEAAESHPEANVITRAVGVTDALDLEAKLVDIELGDTFLLCSDGLSRYVPDSELARMLAQESCSAATEDLLKATLATRARDNVTVIVARAIPDDGDSRTQLNPMSAAARATADDDDPTVLDTKRRGS